MSRQHFSCGLDMTGHKNMQSFSNVRVCCFFSLPFFSCGRELVVPLVAMPGWLPFIPQFSPRCPVLGWAGDPGSPVLGPRTRAGREFHEGA